MRITTDSQNYEDIAEMTRLVTGTSAKYKPSEIASALSGVRLVGDFLANIDPSYGRMFGMTSSIKASAFNRNGGITDVVFPNCVAVGSSAFSRCTGLLRASLNTCKTIDEDAFANCNSLTTVYCPGLMRVGRRAFVYCYSLRTITLSTCSYISEGAFIYCYNLYDMGVPQKLQQIESNAFANCSALKSINLPVCSSVGSNAFGECAMLARVSMPACTAIGERAFAWCPSLRELDLTGVSSPPTLGGSAFYSTPLSVSEWNGNLGSIYVATSVYSKFINNTTWAPYAPIIMPV